MRASDQDRDRAVDVLGDAYADGRLSRQELESRSTAALTATTWGDLHDLTADLPTVQPVRPPDAVVTTRSWADAMAHRRYIRLTVACLLEIVGALAARVFPPAVGLAAIAVLLVLVFPLCWPHGHGRTGRRDR
jgi:hypothetical protein